MDFEPGTFTGLEAREIELFRMELQGVGGLGVEIGCCDGYSTRFILEFSNLELVSVDPMVADPVEKHLIGSRERLRLNTGIFGRRWHFLNVKSEDAFNAWPFVDALDFIYLDGSHKYEDVLYDFHTWMTLLKVGGILAMHDCRMSRPGGARFHDGPSRVADQMLFGKPDKWRIIGEAYSLAVAVKR